MEEALIEMYLAGVSVRCVEDITEALWGTKVSPTISELNKKAYVHIEDWRNRPLQGGKYPYVYMDGIYLRRNWGGKYENVAVRMAIAVNEDGYREALGAAEGMKEDKIGWISFFQWRRGHGLDDVKLIVGDKCLGMLEAAGEVFLETKHQRCIVHFPAEVDYACFCSRGVPISGMVAPTPEKTAHLSSLFSPPDCCFIVNDIGCRSGHDMPAYITFPERR